MEPGRSIDGDLSLERAREMLGQFEREHENLAETPLPLQPPPPHTSDPPPLPWDEDGEAEAQLRAYLDRTKAPRPKGFPPFETLSARIDELSEPPFGSRRNASGEPRAPSPQRPPSDLQWFEDKFQELKTLLLGHKPEPSEIVSINIKLAEIVDRVDRLSAKLPGEWAVAKVETQLAELSRSLDASRAQSAADASRISRAAQEILAATEKAQEARAGFEESARHTVRELGQTVVVSASRAATVTAEQITAALSERGDGARLDRVENELRALNTVSRESCERTTAALERVHETLRVFLEKNEASRPAPAPRKRAGIHNPISSGAHPYAIGEDFGSETEGMPKLDTITLRKPPPPDPNLLDAFKQASEKLMVSKSSGLMRPSEAAAAPAPKTLSSPFSGEEEKSLPLLGIGIVAVVLLIASASLFYLHRTSETPPFHLGVLPQVGSAKVQPNLPPRSSPAEQNKTAATGVANPVPSLFTAADQNHPKPESQPESREDLQTLANAASHGDSEAQFRIAARFLSEGTIQGDPATAARWLARAAGQGHVESQFVLASLYERGVGVPKDEAIAAELYKKAASAGHVRAMHNLGVMLCTKDTLQDYQEAAAWFASAAMSGLTDSQFNLAVLYERGLGLQRNNQKAYFWYQVASLAGDKEATRQADRLKRLLPDTETQAVAEQAGSWRPTVEQLPHLASGSATHG